jgi:regulator of RNase E activity RraA
MKDADQMTQTLTDENRRKLRRVSTATLTTALFKRGFRNVFIQDVRPLSPLAESMVGEAFTLRYIPAREDLDHLGAFEGTAHPQRRAIEDCPPGHVMVIDSRKDARAASAGGILVSRLKQRGVAGIVSDGGFRDSPEIAAMGFPAYHNRPSAPTNLIRHHALDINAPIACGDVAVYPGDIMVGDSEGVCVVPAHIANEVAEEAYEQTAYEDFVAERVRAGQGIFGLYPANAETKAAFQAWRPSWS